MKKDNSIVGFKKHIEELKSFKGETYRNMDLDRLAVYTMSLLVKNNIPLYFDYIVVALFKLFPEKFSLVNFKKYPDADRVEKVLLHLKPRDRNWATGTVREGYSLTETGEEVARQAGELLINPERQKQRKFIPPIRTSTVKEDIGEVRGSTLFKKWSKKKPEDIGDYDIWSFLHAMPYTPKDVLKKYMLRLKQSAKEINDKRAINFLQWVEKKYSNIFKD